MPLRDADIDSRAFEDTPWQEARDEKFQIRGSCLEKIKGNTDQMLEIPYGVTSLRSRSWVTEIPIMDEISRQMVYEEIIFPDMVVQLGESCFAGLGIKQIEIPGTVKKLPYGLFKGGEVSKIILSEGTETIDDEVDQMNPDQWAEGHVTGVSFDHGVMQEDILKIAGLKNLKHLDIAISDIEQDIDLSPLGSLMELQELRVAYMDDVDLSCLANCKNLREVHIVGEHIRNLDGITGAAYLRTLYLCDNTGNRNSDDETPIDFHALSSMSKLEELYLVDIDVAEVAPISELRNLGYLVLSNTGIQDVEALRNLESLYNLEIFGNKSEKVKEQVEMYMKHVETVTVTEDVPYGF